MLGLVAYSVVLILLQSDATFHWTCFRVEPPLIQPTVFELVLLQLVPTQDVAAADPSNACTTIILEHLLLGVIPFVLMNSELMRKLKKSDLQKEEEKKEEDEDDQ